MALRDIDAAERIIWLRLVLYGAAAGVVFGFLSAIYLHIVKGYGILAGIGIIIVGGLLGVGLGFAGHLVISWTGHGLVSMITSSHSSPLSPSFSEQESLIARGRYQDAADSFERHLNAAPTDHAARMALANLYAKQLGRPGDAERLYRQVVSGPSTNNETFAASNALIDLFRTTGNQGRLITELARFADRYRDTRPGAAAKRELMELKSRGDPAT